jgi:DNA processing protein
MKIENRDLLIAYSLLPFLTPSRTRLMLEYFDPLEAATRASPALLQGLLSLNPEQAEQVKNPLNIHTRDQVAAVRDAVVTLADEGYPTLLREIIDPPLALHFRGDLSIVSSPCVAVVGSRRASVYGVNAAAALTRDLVSAGLSIVSGMARGIDAAAHESALASGGRTIAVLGTGIDIVYPKSHTRLARDLAAKGLILSEFPPGTPPMPENFPMRNRVISGLSLGTLIVEATARSGSLITARMAAEQGREVFAVPGSIFSAGSEGTHRLIQYGAKLVHDIDDVLEELPGNLTRKPSQTEEPPAEMREVLEALTREEACHLDTLATQLARPAAALAESLLQLELGGWIRALPGSRYVRN